MPGPSSSGASQFSAVIRCETEYWLSYIMQLSLNQRRPALLRGSMFHSCMEKYCLEDLGLNPQGRSIEDFIDENPFDQNIRMRVLQMAKEYIEKYYPIDTDPDHPDGGFLPISVEEEMAVTIGDLDPGGPFPLLDGVKVTIKCDKIARHSKTGHLRIFDYKTEAASELFEGLPVWDGSGVYKANLQALLYTRVVRHLFPDDVCEGFTIERIRATEPYCFERVPIRFSGHTYAGLPRNLRMYALRRADIHARELAGEKLVQNLDACFQRFTDYESGQRRFADCSFAPLCHRDTDTTWQEVVEKLYTVKGEPLSTRLRILEG